MKAQINTKYMVNYALKPDPVQLETKTQTRVGWGGHFYVGVSPVVSPMSNVTLTLTRSVWGGDKSTLRVGAACPLDISPASREEIESVGLGNERECVFAGYNPTPTLSLLNGAQSATQPTILLN